MRQQRRWTPLRRLPTAHDIPRLTRMFEVFSDEKRLAKLENQFRLKFESSPMGEAGRKWHEHRIATGHLATVPLPGLWGF
jgi:hypothetical protein